MAIIYSYPKTSNIQSSDILIITRFDEEQNNQARSMSVDASSILDYVTANWTGSQNLNQVLTEGNTSLLDAKIGKLYLYDDYFSIDDYLSIRADKGRFNFYDNNDFNYGYITKDIIKLNDEYTVYGLTIGKPSTMTGNRTATFQDASGTVAYLSDIPSITNYGLAAQIDRSIDVINTTVESSLIGDYEGTLSVPANAFAKGDSFKASLMGHISCLSSATLQVRIKTAAGVLLADTGVMDLDAATAKHWKLDIEFTIREIGGEGVAVIVSGGSFTYNRNGSNNPEGFTFISINDNDFDTTIANELVITAQWNNASTSNVIYSDIFTLNKVY